jgi:Tol biopolymer transport system component
LAAKINKIRTLALFLLIVTYTGHAQIVKVLGTTQLTSIKDGEFVVSAVAPDGNSILVSTPGFRGLYSLDVRLKKVQKVTELPGAGFQPCFSPDGSKIYFRTDEYVSMKRYSSLSEFDVRTGTTEIIENKTREITTPVIAGNQLIYLVEGKQKGKVVGSANIKSIATNVYIILENLIPVLYINGIGKQITPNGEGNYIWVSLSPDKTRILYNFGGRGTFVSSLDGKIIADLGRFQAPQWLNDQIIVGMNDHDDGYRVLSSDIICYSLSTKQLTNLTSTSDNIEMYPMPFADGNRIVYQTIKGELFIMDLSIK